MNDDKEHLKDSANTWRHLLSWLSCVLFHSSSRVIEAYSNRSHKWECKTCGRQWED